MGVEMREGRHKIDPRERQIAGRLWSTLLLPIGSPERRFIAECMGARKLSDSAIAILNLAATAEGELPPDVKTLMHRYYGE